MTRPADIIQAKVGRATEAATELIRLAELPLAEFRIRANLFLAERTLQIVVEAVIDVSETVLLARDVRIGGSARESVRLAAEHGIVAGEVLEDMLTLLTYRNRLVHDYEKLRAEESYSQLKRALRVQKRLFPHFLTLAEGFENA